MTEIEKQLLLAELESLERAMHKVEKRRDRQFMESILHPEFREFGRTGRSYEREEILSEIQEDTEFPAIHADNFQVQILTQDVWLLSYLSAHRADDGTLSRRTLRSSLWVAGPQGPQLRFHQGTAVD